jgi:hypothetical protein
VSRAIFAAEVLKWACLVKADAVEEVLEAWIVAEGVKVGMDFEPLENV